MIGVKVISRTFHLLGCAVCSTLSVAMERYNVKHWTIGVSERRAIATMPESIVSSQKKFGNCPQSVRTLSSY